MNRESFIRLAIAAIRRNAGKPIEEQAEAIATAMDIVAEALGDAAPAAAPVMPPPLTRTAFPSVNPAAIMPVEPETAQPDPFAPAPVIHNDQPLVTLETRIPDKIERVEPAGGIITHAPPGKSPKPQGRMKVEQLSQLVQDNTPVSLPINVPMEDGNVSRAVLQRNVVSQHNYDSVQLIYFPANATLSARELTETVVVLHVDDAPFDFPNIVRNLQREAAQAIRPRRIPQSVMPTVNLGPVRHSEDNYKDPALSGQTEAVFLTLG